MVCDDHPIFRNGVVSCLVENPDIEIMAEAADGESCIAKLEIFKPDVLIADLSMPVIDGFEILEWVRKNQPGMKVIILSMHAELAYVKRAKELGACGFMAKEDAQSELLTAIQTEAGDFYTSESIGVKSRDKIALLGDVSIADRLRNVSDAEYRVLELLTTSNTSREIAEKLHVSIRTVEAHRANLASKLDAKGPNKLLEMAVRHREEILSR